MTIVSWVETYFCAAHRDEQDNIHGHTWRVRVYVPFKGHDAVMLKAALEQACKEMDHKVLRPQLAWAEDLALSFALSFVDKSNVQPCRVDVWRDPEGMGATWTA